MFVFQKPKADEAQSKQAAAVQEVATTVACMLAFLAAIRVA
jgi:hypothetical protein